MLQFRAIQSFVVAVLLSPSNPSSHNRGDGDAIERLWWSGRPARAAAAAERQFERIGGAGPEQRFAPQAPSHPLRAIAVPRYASKRNASRVRDESLAIAKR